MGTIADLDEVMYTCGLDVLHPGGLRGTEELARRCGVAPGMRVLDIGSGKGATACHVAERFGCTVVGLDRSGRMVHYARAKADELGLSDRVTFIEGSALELPFEDESFDVVLSECTTTLLDVERAFAEFLRVLKRGGAVGDSDMVWSKPPPAELTAAVARLWEGFRTMTLAEWQAFFERHGLLDVQSSEFDESFSDMQASIVRDLGPGGLLRVAVLLLEREDLRNAVGEFRRLARDYQDYFGYGCVVGRKS